MLEHIEPPTKPPTSSVYHFKVVRLIGFGHLEVLSTFLGANYLDYVMMVEIARSAGDLRGAEPQGADCVTDL